MAVAERAGVLYRSARWTPDSLGTLAGALDPSALRKLGDRDLLAAWEDTLAALLDPASSERRELDVALPTLCRLSAAGLQAGLEAVLGGSRRGARQLLAEATPAPDPSPVLVVLASNLPGLAVQPLLPALARRRPAILKSPSAEPLFTPALVAALGRREPRLAPALAAVTWPGGAAALEAPLLAAVGRVVAYGGAESLADLERRAPGKVVGFGPKGSLAAVGDEVDPRSIAAGLARDVALFDQRGCLSVQAVYTAGDAGALARALAAELAELAGRWPPGPLDPALAAAVQQVRSEADLRGLWRADLPLAAGTVVVEPLPDWRPSPGLRTVRVHPLPQIERLPEILAPWSGRLQGAALAGARAQALAPALERLGCSRLTPPGELQTPDALWHNGGLPPLEALGEPPRQ